MFVGGGGTFVDGGGGLIAGYSGRFLSCAKKTKGMYKNTGIINGEKEKEQITS